MNEEKTTTTTTLEESAFARVLAKLMEARGIPADQEHALELAEKSGLDREVFRVRLAGEDVPCGDLTRFAEELALSIPEMDVLALAYTYEEEREPEDPAPGHITRPEEVVVGYEELPEEQRMRPCVAGWGARATTNAPEMLPTGSIPGTGIPRSAPSTPAPTSSPWRRWT